MQNYAANLVNYASTNLILRFLRFYAICIKSSSLPSNTNKNSRSRDQKFADHFQKWTIDLTKKLSVFIFRIKLCITIIQIPKSHLICIFTFSASLLREKINDLNTVL